MRMPVIVAKGIVILLCGLAMGYAMGRSLAHDAARGRTLTIKQYIADFEHHREDLVSSDIPMPGALAIGVAMALAAFGAYEVLALGLATFITFVDRRTATPPATGPTSGWAA